MWISNVATSPTPLLEGDPSTALYAEVVFDRPLDLPYTYAVPATLHAQIAVGKRIEAPFGKGDRRTVGYCVRVTTVAPHREVKAIQRVLDAEILLTEELLRLTRWMADYYLCGWGQVLHAVLPSSVRDNAGLREVVYLQPSPNPELLRALPKLPAKQATIWSILRKQSEPMEQRELMRLARCGPSPIQTMLARGLIQRHTTQVDVYEQAVASNQPPPTIELNPDQQRVWSTIQTAVQTGGYQAYLLHGVTGSGKTEIYLQAIAEVIAQGKEAIVLVPEIALTPQTIERFQGRCGKIAVLHSHLSDTERGAHWRRVAQGLVQVVVGARSAVFAPTRKLGLIIIDEEHEHSFKQEATPRYHARDVAVMRARLENVPILMGSATPSLESWHNVERGHYQLLSMPQRVLKRPMPEVRLIDLRHEPKSHKHAQALSPSLEAAMQQALEAKGQVMLLLNRRGFATHVHCPACGLVVQCQHCDLALTYHRQREALLCHHCGEEAALLQKCPGCGQATIRYHGLGTEKLQAEVQARFPDRIVQRMDSDTMARPGSHARILDAFRGGLIDILLGTQMIAKGLDFPNVTLVGVINADVGLHMPDFRAAERTFQLLAQVAGRTGRGDKPGQVLIQTYTPEHPSIGLVVRHDYLRFAALELEHRRKHAYPPFERLARLIIRGEKQEVTAAFADTLAGAFREAQRLLQQRQPSLPEVRVLGPAEAPVFRLKDYFRYHFQLQAPQAGVLHQLLREVLGVLRPPHGVEFQIDIDPFSML